MEDNRKNERALAEKHGKALFDIISRFEEEDGEGRTTQLRLARKGEYFFRGYQNLYWDYEVNDYRDEAESEEFEDDDSYYTKVINIYRAHGESIIAALTVDVPNISFLPDNAQNSADLRAAINYTNAAILIQRHNNAPLLFVKAVYLLWTQGFVAAYNYNDASSEYGIIEEPKIEEREVKVKEYHCPECGAELEENQINTAARKEVWYNEETGQENVEEQPATQCPSCQSIITPEEGEHEEKVPQIVGTTKLPKTREKIKVYGITNVKVRTSATCQADTPYLILESEEHASQIRFKYRIDSVQYGEGDDPEEKEARDVPGLAGSSGNVTVKHIWFRPETFYYDSTEQGDELLEDFPDGAYGIFVNSECLKLCAEKLDDHWTILEVPTSSHIHADPMGKPLMDIQEIKNEIFNLAIQTMEQGISQNFVDSEILDLDAYSKTAHKPGNLFPVTPKAGQRIADGFYATRTASLSREVGEINNNLTTDGQLVSGALPSIYGGAISGGSKTFAEYAASRQQALQRLGTAYKAASIWWAKVMAKAIPEFIESLMEDEYFSVKENDVYLNKIIVADIESGIVGSVEPDSSSSFPLSWSQKRDILLELVKMNMPEINEAILTPENATLLSQLIGLPELTLPGQNSRLKQYKEIQMMLSSAPMDSGQGELESSVPIDPDVDDHLVESKVCLEFLQSMTGQELKESNPEAFLNIVAHLKAHRMALQPPPQSQPTEGQELMGPNNTGAQPPVPFPVQGPR